MWVGGVADSQTRSKPIKKKNHPGNRPFRPEFHLLFSQISQKPRFGRDLPKKRFFLHLPLQWFANNGCLQCFAYNVYLFTPYCHLFVHEGRLENWKYVGF